MDPFDVVTLTTVMERTCDSPHRLLDPRGNQAELTRSGRRRTNKKDLGCLRSKWSGALFLY
jgi:hypothetical protein